VIPPFVERYFNYYNCRRSFKLNKIHIVSLIKHITALQHSRLIASTFSFKLVNESQLNVSYESLIIKYINGLKMIMKYVIVN
jgi:hypothetical protein